MEHKDKPPVDYVREDFTPKTSNPVGLLFLLVALPATIAIGTMAGVYIAGLF